MPHRIKIHTIAKLQSRILIFLFILIFGLVLSTLGFREYLQYQTISRVDDFPSCGINELTQINLGDTQQWLLIRGQDTTNPVILFLHGGPGAPLFPVARNIGITSQLECSFTVVYWEQRGTGKSYHPSIPESTMTIDQLIRDTRELTQWLQQRFKMPAIYLLGRSWGSFIGLLTVSQYPGLYQGYIGVGQLIHPLRNDSISYRYTLELAQKYQHTNALEALHQIDFPPWSYSKMLTQRRLLTQLHDRFMRETYQHYPINQFRTLLATPEYTLMDIIRMGLDPYHSIRHFWNKKYYQYNLMKQIPRITIPVLFIAGRHDYFTPAALAFTYYQRLEAPAGKTFIWMENSGHHPERKEPEKFLQALREFTRQTAAQKK